MNARFGLAFLWIIIPVSCLFAQGNKMVELKPIQAQGWNYYYDFQRVNSAYALQIPLQALEDEEINKRFKRYTTYQTFRGFGYLATFIYIISSTSYTQSSDNVFIGMIGASVALDLGFSIAGHSQIRKAIDRYNLLILPRRVGLATLKLPHGNGYGINLSFPIN